MSQPDHSGDISHLMFSAMGHMEKQVCLQPGLAKTTSTMNSGTYEKYKRYEFLRSYQEAAAAACPPTAKSVNPCLEARVFEQKEFDTDEHTSMSQEETYAIVIFDTPTDYIQQTSTDNAARRQYSTPQIIPGDVMSPTRPKELQLQRPPPEFDSFKKHMKPPTTKAEKEVMEANEKSGNWLTCTHCVAHNVSCTHQFHCSQCRAKNIICQWALCKHSLACWNVGCRYIHPWQIQQFQEAGLSWPIQLYQSPDPSVSEADRVALPRLGSAIRKSFSNRDGWIGSPPAYLEDLYGRPAVIRYFAVLRDSKMERKLSPTSDITKQQVKEKAGQVQSPQISAPTTRTKTLPKKSLPISNTKSPQEWSKDMVEARKGEPVIDNPDDVFRTPTDVAEFNVTRDKYYPGMEDVTYRALKGCPLKPLEHMGDAEAQHWLVVQAILRVKPKLPGTYK
ncbi:hypothetical protein KCU92_g1059, partial [Aureobasidium melanogenum]